MGGSRKDLAQDGLALGGSHKDLRMTWEAMALPESTQVPVGPGLPRALAAFPGARAGTWGKGKAVRQAAVAACPGQIGIPHAG